MPGHNALSPRTLRLAIGALIWAALMAGGYLLLAPGGAADEAAPPASDIPLNHSPPSEFDEAARQAAWERADERMLRNFDEVAAATDEDLEQLYAFFDEARGGSRAFAEALLSLRGKAAYVQGLAGGTAHEDYVRACFAEHVFDPEELARLIESILTRLVGRIQEGEDRVLVELRADLVDLSAGGTLVLPSLRDDEAFRLRFEAMVERVAPAIAEDCGTLLGKQAIDLAVTPIIQQILASMAARMGISAATLGVGSYSGAVSLGIGVAVSIAVDRLLDWALLQAGYDPAAIIADRVSDFVSELQRFIFTGQWIDQRLFEFPLLNPDLPDDVWIGSDGPGGAEMATHPGLITLVSDLHWARTELFVKAVWHVIHEGGEQ